MLMALSGMYGPMSFSVFREAVKTTTTRVTFIEGKAGDSWLCDKIRESIQAFIRMDHPSVSFRVYAPILVRGPSSFNLWAALANHGQVYSPPNPPTWGWTTTELGSDWHWVTSARVLTRAVAKKELKLKRPLEKKPRKEGEPTWTDLFLERAIPWLNEDPIWFHHASP
ncbi:hypothetical protein Pmar_PMAR007868 [Perkinsus marinus ATCC 50983]|uniref:Uncharacterized protein n=1 Tax=Perkinsus marinus (strain ATCC 50983 / TXsc) TaxID=423536 RepID=C5K966_PERM5|nr:hypothetical protein Pmar_PMAR007868 [Perkinsus marinus ATCC 50983]EER18972.1 hypothetical protein Pmar_PMAR007868 [Perkinsus marinus ATCC 50983]|eukprot:XP_002787176.1 hypothetical protein Pmar_PMAR007868 [Perkinsus marinus ATCC 50983]